MTETKAPYDAGSAPIDEYLTRRAGAAWEVYRLVGQTEMHYANCPNVDAALNVAAALNAYNPSDTARFTLAVSFGDGSRLVVRVESPDGESCLASDAYYLHLFDALQRIEAERGDAAGEAGNISF